MFKISVTYSLATEYQPKCLHLVLRCTFGRRREGRHNPFTPDILISFVHFCPDFFKGRVLKADKCLGFFTSFDLMDKISSRNLHMNAQ